MRSKSIKSSKEALLEMATGYRTTQALYVVAKLRIADLLQDEPKSANRVAEKVGADPRALFRVMRALASLGVFSQDNSGRFGLTPISDLLCSDNPHTLLYNILLYGNEHYRAAGDLLHTVMTGEIAFDHIHGKNRFQYLTENPEASTIFNAAMAHVSRRLKNPLGSYVLKDKHLVIDVGGGQGDVISFILRANPEMRGILFDLRHAVRNAKSNLKKLGVGKRCKVIVGSAFEYIPSGGDIYLMSRFLHNFSNENASIILSNCHKVIRKDGILLLRESVLPEGNEYAMAKQVDLVMLYMSEGMERTALEWSNLLESCGFRISKILMRKGYFDLIEARPI